MIMEKFEAVGGVFPTPRDGSAGDQSAHVKIGRFGTGDSAGSTVIFVVSEGNHEEHFLVPPQTRHTQI